jgi:hypothetical protein
MDKLKQPFWELAMALIAAAGVFAVINTKLAIISWLFGIGFAVIFSKLLWDIYEVVFPVRLLSVRLQSTKTVEQNSSYNLDLKIIMYFSSSERIRLDPYVKMRFDKTTENALGDLHFFHTRELCMNSENDAPFREIKDGGLEALAACTLTGLDDETIAKYNDIFTNAQIDIGWKILGRRYVWKKKIAYGTMEVITGGK